VDSNCFTPHSGAGTETRPYRGYSFVYDDEQFRTTLYSGEADD